MVTAHGAQAIGDSETAITESDPMMAQKQGTQPFFSKIPPWAMVTTVVMVGAIAGTIGAVIAGLGPHGNDPPPSPCCAGVYGARKPFSALSEGERNQIANAFKQMKETPTPWAEDPNVPVRWHGMDWYNTLVLIHTTQPPENPFAHMGTAFPGWHRLFMEVLEKGMRAVGCNIPMPYWDWTDPMETQALWDWMGGDGDPEQHNCLVKGPFAYPEWNLSTKVVGWTEPGMQGQCLSRAFATWGISVVDIVDTSRLPSKDSVESCAQVELFDSWPFDGSAIGAMSFRNCIEGYDTPKNKAQTAVQGYHSAHLIHNIVHLFMGEAMSQTSAPNDPAFWFHHSQIDRLYEKWLQSNEKKPGANAQVEFKTGVEAYPARIKKVFGMGSACESVTDLRVWMSICEDYPAVCIKVGDGSSHDWDRFVECAYSRSKYGHQVVSNHVYGKRILLAFPEDDEQAAYMPSLPDTYTDPYVFRTNPKYPLLVGDDNTSANATCLYEEIILSADVNGFFMPDPTIYTRQLLIHLRTPYWFNRKNDPEDGSTEDRETAKTIRKMKSQKRSGKSESGESPSPSGVSTTSRLDDNDDGERKPFDCKVPTAFGDKNFKCVTFYAIATAINGTQKANMSGYGPLHYWMPGYFNAIKGFPLAVSLGGSASVPFSTCSGGPWGCASSELSQQAVHGQQQPIWDGADAKYLAPDSSKVAFAMLEKVDCMSLSALQENGFVIEGMAPGAKKMWPSTAPFCVVKGSYVLTEPQKKLLDSGELPCLGSTCEEPVLNPDSGTGETRHGYLVADRAAALFMGPQVYPFSMATSAQPLPGVPIEKLGKARFNTQDTPMDISDFLYTGARPGHNTEDLMYPLRELGYTESPADRFDADPNLYR